MRVVDEHGSAALTLAAVAARVGVATPSLYNHVSSLAQLRTLMAIQVMEALAGRLTAAVLGRARDEAVAALMHSYRGFVLEHPERYALLPPDPLGHPELAAAGEQLLAVVAAVVRGYALADSDLVHAIRLLRTVGHGFASIEAAGGFGLAENPDDTYRQLIDMLLTHLSASARVAAEQEGGDT